MKLLHKLSGLNYMLLIFFSILISCNHSTQPEDDSATPRKKWESLGFDSYEFEQSFICFCIPPAGRFQRVLVRDNMIQEITDVATGAALSPDKFFLFKTVEQLHEFVESIDADSVARFDLEYDAQYNFPSSIYVDYDERIADEEIGYESRNFRPLR